MIWNNGMIRETLVHSHTDYLKRIEQESEPDDACTEVANDSQMLSRSVYSGASARNLRRSRPERADEGYVRFFIFIPT